MPTQWEAKKKFVADVNALARGALLMVTADYRGLSAPELSELRVRASARDVPMRVLKNTLAKRALAGTAYERLGDELSGPLLAAFSCAAGEPGAAAQVLRDYRKDNEKLEIKSVSLPNELLSAADIDRLADLPTRAEALAKLMGLMRAPIAQLAVVFLRLPERLARCVAAYADQKKERGERQFTEPGSK